MQETSNRRRQAVPNARRTVNWTENQRRPSSGIEQPSEARNLLQILHRRRTGVCGETGRPSIYYEPDTRNLSGSDRTATGRKIDRRASRWECKGWDRIGGDSHWRRRPWNNAKVLFAGFASFKRSLFRTDCFVEKNAKRDFNGRSGVERDNSNQRLP